MNCCVVTGRRYQCHWSW